MIEPAALNTIEAAALLGISRKTFWLMRRRYGLKRTASSNDRRPKFKREDVLALLDKVAPEFIEGSDEWVAEMRRRAKEAAAAFD